MIAPLNHDSLKAAVALATAAWNKQAGRLNQWPNLGKDEQIELVAEELTRSKVAPCSFDTDGDGNCQHCARNGGCAKHWASIALTKIKLGSAR